MRNLFDAIVISRKRTINNASAKLKLEGRQIPVVDTIKLLTITIDSKLKIQNHINNLIGQ